MSAVGDSNAANLVIVLEPGLVYVKAVDPEAHSDGLEPVLRQTIEDWFDARPRLMIDRCEPVVDNGGLQGIHVWYSDICNHLRGENIQPSSASASPSPSTSTAMTVEVHGLIAERFPKEYVEAVFVDTMRVAREAEDRQDTLVVINSRGVAVLFDRRAHRGGVIPAEFIEQVIDGTPKAKLKAWMAAPRSRFYVMRIAGSWYANS